MRNSESNLIADKPTTNVKNVSSELLPEKNECEHNELPNHDTRISKSPTPKETSDINLPSSKCVTYDFFYDSLAAYYIFETFVTFFWNL